MTRKIRRKGPLLAALCLLTMLAPACSSSRASQRMPVEPDAYARSAKTSALNTMSVADTGGGPGIAPAPPGRMLRRNASLGLAVEQPSQAAERAEQIVTNTGGHLEHAHRHTEDSVNLGFRVPSERLEETLDALAALGRTTRRSLSSDDVTDQVVDLDAQLRNLRALRDRLRALLERADEVSEILEIERELNRVQTRIDSLAGQLERIQKDVALSILGLELVQEEPERILGPLGMIGYGTKWFFEKLWMIRPGRP